MMRVQPCFSENVGYRLNQAILIYTKEGTEGSAVATHNPVSFDSKGVPRIGPGAPLSPVALQEIARSLMGAKATTARQLISPNLLLADADLLVWHLPSHRRTMYFQTDNQAFNAACNGRAALHPNLLFLAKSRDLYVWALASAERPTLDTKLYRAPYFNVYHNGHLCEGSYKLPDHYRPDGIPEWEAAFFDTHFSHSNFDQRELTNFPNGHNALWQAMTKQGRGAARSFDPAWLKPVLTDGKSKEKPLTLGQVIEI